MTQSEEKNQPRPDLSTELVPIRLDVKLYGRHVREAFCMEPVEDERYIAHVVRQLCLELQLPKNSEQTLFLLIKDQINKFKDSAEQINASNEDQGRLEVIKLNFRLRQTHIQDKFLWDVGDSSADPETFATVTCDDLGLPRDFAPEIACRIREQIIEYRKAGRRGSTPPVKADEKSHSKRQGRNSSKGEGAAKRKHMEGSSNGQRGIYDSQVVRKRSEWHSWCPRVRELSEQEIRQTKEKRPRTQQPAQPSSPSQLPQAVSPQTQGHQPTSSENPAPQNPTQQSNQSKRNRNRKSQNAARTKTAPKQGPTLSITTDALLPEPTIASPGVRPVFSQPQNPQPLPSPVQNHQLVPNSHIPHPNPVNPFQMMPGNPGTVQWQPNASAMLSLQGGIGAGGGGQTGGAKFMDQYVQQLQHTWRQRQQEQQVRSGVVMNGQNVGQMDRGVHGHMSGLQPGGFPGGNMLGQFQNGGGQGAGGLQANGDPNNPLTWMGLNQHFNPMHFR